MTALCADKNTQCLNNFLGVRVTIPEQLRKVIPMSNEIVKNIPSNGFEKSKQQTSNQRLKLDHGFIMNRIIRDEI